MANMTAVIDARPDVIPTISVACTGGVYGFFGTIISLPGSTFGLVLKNRNFRDPFTVPLG